MEERSHLEGLIKLNAIENFLEEDEIILGKDEIIRLWEVGILNDLAYFFFIIKTEIRHGWKHRVEKIEGSYLFPHKIELDGADIDHLMHKWKGQTPKNEAGDVKVLTASAIMKALAALAKKEVAIPRSKQLTLFMGYEAPWTRNKVSPEEALTPIEREIDRREMRE